MLRKEKGIERYKCCLTASKLFLLSRLFRFKVYQ